MFDDYSVIFLERQKRGVFLWKERDENGKFKTKCGIGWMISNNYGVTPLEFTNEWDLEIRFGNNLEMHQSANILIVIDLALIKRCLIL